jgi:serine/threonine protein kinase
MGAVYRVWDLKRNVLLAMKVLHADLADDPSMFKRFQREARALQRLAHPNIVPFYGLYHAGDLVFLLERFIDGPSLKDILRSGKGSSLPVDQALVYLKAVSSALGYAHAHGVVHCDVKPGNVMVDRGGSVYLTDFGVARHAESTTTTLGFAGTGGYMAPEQIRGEPVSPATDVYALGVMLYEMLTGERPFRGDERETEGKGSTGAERVRWAHLHLPPPDPRMKNAALPPELTQVILKALAKDAEGRLGGARQLFEAACRAAAMEEGEVADRVVPIGGEVSPDQILGTIDQPASMPEGGADRPRRTARVATKMSWQLGAALAIGGIALVGALLTLINSHAGNAAKMLSRHQLVHKPRAPRFRYPQHRPPQA